MTVRFLIVFSAVLSFASLGFCGAFQKTKDGKTSVWNEHPKKGDIASWVGDRDDEGYANGFGTLTWSKEEDGKSVVYARYFGNMVHGKFDGGVNAHSNGRTSHAFFTEGTRTSPWATGTAPMLGPVPEKKGRTKKERALATEANEPRETPPTPKRPVPDLEKVRKEAAVPPSPTLAPQPTEKPRSEEKESVPREAEATPTLPPIPEKVATPIAAEPLPIPSSTPPAVAETRNPPLTRETETPTPSPSVIPSPTPPLVAQKEEATPRAPEPTPPAIPTPRPLRSPPKSSRGPSAKPKRTVDESLRALAGPPSSLRKDSVSEAQAQNGSSANPPLSKDEVVDLANTVARTHGYHLGDFEHSPPEYNEVDETWTVSYDEKAEESSSAGKHFSVRIDGKTKKSTIVSPP